MNIMNNEWVSINSKSKQPPYDEGTMSYSCDVLLTDGKNIWVGFIDFETGECLGINKYNVRSEYVKKQPTHWMTLPKLP